MAVEHDPIAEAGPQELPEEIAQVADVGHRSKIGRQLAGLPEGRRQEPALGSRPPATLMAVVVEVDVGRGKTQVVDDARILHNRDCDTVVVGCQRSRFSATITDPLFRSGQPLELGDAADTVDVAVGQAEPMSLPTRIR